MTWDAIDRVRSMLALDPIETVFEWGCGGSTLFWAKHGLTVTSIEHNEAWAKRIQALADADGAGRVNVKYVPPQPTGRIQSLRCPGFFDRYVCSIHEMADKADLICVDGRVRNACVQESMFRTNKWLILDNSDREDYRQSMERLIGWNSEHFTGHGPDGNGVRWRTSIFRRV
jgi:hypothetical protein